MATREVNRFTGESVLGQLAGDRIASTLRRIGIDLSELETAAEIADGIKRFQRERGLLDRGEIDPGTTDEFARVLNLLSPVSVDLKLVSPGRPNLAGLRIEVIAEALEGDPAVVSSSTATVEGARVAFEPPATMHPEEVRYQVRVLGWDGTELITRDFDPSLRDDPLEIPPSAVPSRFNQLSGQLRRSTQTLDEVIKMAPDRQAWFLRRLGLERGDVEALRVADRLSGALGLGQEATFALALAGFTDAEAVNQMPVDVTLATLYDAVERNEIGNFEEQAVRRSLRRRRLAYMGREADLMERASEGDVVRLVLGAGPKAGHVVEALERAGPSALRSDDAAALSDDELQQIYVAFELDEFLDAPRGVVTRIWERLPTKQSVREVGKFSNEEWDEVAALFADYLPAGTDLTTFSSGLRRRVDLRFPSLSAAQLVEAINDTVFQLAAGPKDIVVRALRDDGALDPEGGQLWRRLHAADDLLVLEELDDPTERETAEQTLLLLDRLQSLVPRHADPDLPAPAQVVEGLLRLGFNTSASIASLAPEEFAHRVGLELDARTIREVHQRAVARHAIVANLIVETVNLPYRQKISAIDESPIRDAIDAIRNSAAPSLRKLFGDLDYCACTHCQSIFSPAAYLADLLHFMANRPAKPDGGGGARSLLDVLEARRPDLMETDLDCANTDRLLPHIDLATEILERAILKKSPTRADCQTTLTDAELLAEPEHTYEEAGSELAKAVFPWTLPYERPLDELRTYLGAVGVPRLRLLREADPVMQYRSLEVATEHLGLSNGVLRLLRRNRWQLGSSNDWTGGGWRDSQLWGFKRSLGRPPQFTVVDRKAEEPLVGDWVDILRSRVSVLMQQSGLAFDELVRLLRSRFVNPNQTWPIIAGLESCKATEMSVEWLTPDLLDRLRKLTLLWRRTGWEPEELDGVLVACGSVVDDSVLVLLSNLEDLHKRLKVSRLLILAAWVRIDVHSYPEASDLPAKASQLDQLVSAWRRTRRASADPFILDGSDNFKRNAGGSRPRVGEFATELAAVVGQRLAELRVAQPSTFGDAQELTPRVVGQAALISSLLKNRRLRAAELRAAIDLFGADPFDHATNAAELADRSARLLEFFDFVALAQLSPSSIATLAWLLRGEIIGDASVEPSRATTSRLGRELSRAVSSVDAEISGAMANPIVGARALLSRAGWTSEGIEQILDAAAVDSGDNSVVSISTVVIESSDVAAVSQFVNYDVRNRVLTTVAGLSDGELAGLTALSPDVRWRVAVRALPRRNAAVFPLAIVAPPNLQEVGERLALITPAVLYDPIIGELRVLGAPSASQRRAIGDLDPQQIWRNAVARIPVANNSLPAVAAVLAGPEQDVINAEVATWLLPGLRVTVDNEAARLSSNGYFDRRHDAALVGLLPGNADWDNAVSMLRTQLEQPIDKLERQLVSAVPVQFVADVVTSTPFAAAPPQVGTTDSGQSGHAWYDAGSNQLKVRGALARSEADRLKNMPATTQQFRDAVDQMAAPVQVHSTLGSWLAYEPASASIVTNRPPEPAEIVGANKVSSPAVIDALGRLRPRRLWGSAVSRAEIATIFTAGFSGEQRARRLVELCSQPLGSFLRSAAIQTTIAVASGIQPPVLEGLSTQLAEPGQSNPLEILFSASVADFEDDQSVAMAVVEWFLRCAAVIRSAGLATDDGAAALVAAGRRFWRELSALHLGAAPTEGWIRLKMLSRALALVGPAAPTVRRLISEDHDPKSFRQELADTLTLPIDEFDALLVLPMALASADNCRDTRRLAATVTVAKSAAALRISLATWVRLAAGRPDQTVAGIARDAVRTLLGREGWHERARSLRDPIRQRTRDALVSYLVNREELRSSDDLYKLFLIDTQTEPIVLTSRIAAAIGSVQLFGARVVLGLEPDVPASAIDSQRWDRLCRYQVWAAERKVFVYPYKYTSPATRSTATQLFRARANALAAGDLTSASGGSLVTSYIDGLSDIGMMRISNCWRSSDGSLVVIGRTHSAPYVYYWRERTPGGRWTAWMSLDVKTKSPAVAPVEIDNRRLVVWVETDEKASAVDPTASPSLPQKYRVATLHWSELRPGEGGSSRTAGAIELEAPPGAPDPGNYLWSGNSQAIPLVTTTQIRVENGYRPGQTLTVGIAERPEDFGYSNSARAGIPRFLYTPSISAFDVTTSKRALILESQGLGGRAAPAHNGEIDLWSATKQAKTLRVPLARSAATIDRVAAYEKPSWVYLGISDDPGSQSSLLPVLVCDQTSTGESEYYDAQWVKKSFVYDRFSPLINDGVIATAFGRSYLVETRPGTPLPQIAVAMINIPWVDELRARSNRPRAIYDPTTQDLTDETKDAIGPVVGTKLNYYRGGFRFVSDLELTRNGNPVGAGWGDNPFHNNLGPVERFDFALDAPAHPYCWETFFHLPALVADAYRRAGRFEDAMHWYQCIFNPRSSAQPWITKPFRQRPGDVPINIRSLLSAEADAASEAGQSLRAQLEAWLASPFDPHKIAELRPWTYQWWAALAYIDNLIEKGDAEFRSVGADSARRATLWYTEARELLGDRPEGLPARPAPARNFRELGTSVHAIFEVLETFVPWFEVVESLNEPPTLFHTDYFCVPPDDGLVERWNLLEARFVNLHNSRDIDGIERALPLFDPLIDPGLLVRAAEAGLDPQAVLQEVDAPPGPWRFDALLSRALEMANEAASLGQQLLAAIEKGDAEEMQLARAENEMQLLVRIGETRDQQLAEAFHQFQSVLASDRVVQARGDYYAAMLRESGRVSISPQLNPDVHSRVLRGLFSVIEDFVGDLDDALAGLSSVTARVSGAVGPLLDRAKELVSEQAGVAIPGEELTLAISKTESRQLEELNRSNDLYSKAADREALAQTLSYIPDFTLGAQGISSPVVQASFGGTQVSRAVGFTASNIRSEAAELANRAQMHGIVAGYERREADWKHQIGIAALERTQLSSQIAAAGFRWATAAADRNSHILQLEHAQAITETISQKFTNREMYQLHADELERLYRTTLGLAGRLARKAEAAFQNDVGDVGTTYIRGDYWSAGRRGLLAAEQLRADIRRLQVAREEQPAPVAGLTTTISLRQVDPSALVRLRVTGAAEFEIPEYVFDLARPGLYRRRIHSVAVSIPCVVGPHTALHATVRLLRSAQRLAPTLSAGYDRQAQDSRFKEELAPVEYIVTSGGVAQTGLLDPTNTAGQRRPFEGRGVISRWRVELPPEIRTFDYNTIDDVVMAITYTARDGGKQLAEAATESLVQVRERATPDSAGFCRLFSCRYEFAGWRDATGAAEEIQVDLYERFPYMFMGLKIEVVATRVVFRGRSPLDPADYVNASWSAADGEPTLLSGLQPYGAVESSLSIVLDTEGWLPEWGTPRERTRTLSLKGVSADKRAALADIWLIVEMKAAVP